MAECNLKSATLAVNIQPYTVAVATAFADLVPAVAADNAVHLEAIFVTNIHATLACRVTIVHRIGGVDVEIAFNKAVSRGATLNFLINKPLYLKVGDSVKIKSESNATASVVAPGAKLIGP